MPWMTSRASSNAWNASPGERRGPPIASIASQNPPAPRASSKRPPDSRSSETAARATTAGWRKGTLSTLGATRMRDVDASTHDIRVQVSRNRGWYGWSWNVTRSKPSSSLKTASATVAAGSAFEGVMKVPNSRG